MVLKILRAQKVVVTPNKVTVVHTWTGTVALRGLGRRLLLASRSPAPAPDIATQGRLGAPRRTLMTPAGGHLEGATGAHNSGQR
ncbi:hypothetical protein E2C01_012326 [Portunus trituberculatus]|uniref:Uncharacterized protein n=1 Tax=Portunus trituberculatus TaxID=210409 RepID=A0A5B7DDR5_PORTR|nr:hypothetical protein [Portunus trituberculatus]